MGMFGFRSGVLMGGLLGYVLGTRAGRQRYERIASLGRSLSQSRPAQQLTSEVRSIADRAGDALSTKAAAQVSKVTGAVRDRVPGGRAESDGPPPAGGDGADQSPSR